jgi:hypothetical protein
MVLLSILWLSVLDASVSAMMFGRSSTLIMVNWGITSPPE